MFDLITGKAEHIPVRSAGALVISTALQVLLASAVLVPLLFVTGALPQPPVMLAFVAAPPAPPPPPPPPPPPAPKRETPPPTRPVPTSSASAAPIAPPREIEPEPFDDGGEEGVPGGVEGGIPGGVLAGIVGGLPDVPLPPPPPPPPVRRDPVRVGGQVKQPALVRRVEPVYPSMAVHAHIEGMVILEAIVDRDGTVEEVKVLRSAGALLDNAALTAVRQWQYSPVLLNGIPERFILTVMLSFNLEKGKE
jgi:protein TonB